MANKPIPNVAKIKLKLATDENFTDDDRRFSLRLPKHQTPNTQQQTTSSKQQIANSKHNKSNYANFIIIITKQIIQIIIIVASWINNFKWTTLASQGKLRVLIAVRIVNYEHNQYITRDKVKLIDLLQQEKTTIV